MNRRQRIIVAEAFKTRPGIVYTEDHSVSLEDEQKVGILKDLFTLPLADLTEIQKYSRNRKSK